MAGFKTALKQQYLKRRYACLIQCIRDYHPKTKCSLDDAGNAIIQFDGKIFYGFSNSSADENIHKLIRKALPFDFQGRHYRIFKDLITRYLYPHMLPHVKPKCRNYFMSGFHGQHKDAIPDIKDPRLRSKLTDVFTPKKSDVIINGGANLGFGDMRLSTMVPQGLIIAIEAEKTCYDILRKNIEQNDLQNVRPLNRALWNKNETVHLKTGGHQDNSLIEGILDTTGDMKVNGVTIDSIVESQGLNQVDFVSLTLNGAEVEALEGMRETMSRFRPRIRIAGWYRRNDQPIWKLCREKIMKYPYEIAVGKRGSLYAY